MTGRNENIRNDGDESINFRNYIITSVAIKLLAISYKKLYRLAKNEGWTVIKRGKTNYYLKSDVLEYKNNNINDTLDINKEYISEEELAKKLNIEKKKVYYMAKKGKWTRVTSKNKNFYLMSEFIEYKNRVNEIETNYINVEKGTKLLEISANYFYDLANKEKWKIIKEGKANYYLKSDVINYLVEKQMIQKKYVTKNKGAEHMNMSIFSFNEFLKEYNISKYCKGKECRFDVETLNYYIKLRNNWFDDVITKQKAFDLCKNNIGFYYLEKKYNIKAVKIPIYAITLNIKHKTYYDKNKFLNAIKKEEKLYLKYILPIEACKQLGVELNSLENIIKELDAKKFTKVINKYKYISVELVENIKQLQDKFCYEHYNLAEVRRKLPYKLPRKLGSIICRVQVPLYARSKRTNLSYRSIVYKKEDLDTYLNINENPQQMGYILRKDAMDILGFTDDMFIKFVREYKLQYINITGKFYCLQEDVNFFVEQQKDFENQYVTNVMIKNEYGRTLHCVKKNKITKYNVPLFARNFKKFGKADFCYSREEIKSYLQEFNLNESIENIVGQTLFETFKLRIDYYKRELEVFNNSTYTKDKWIEFVENRAIKSENVSKKYKEGLIRKLISTTLDLEVLINNNNNKEIYSIPTSQVNLWFKGIRDEKKRILIYKFLEMVNDDVKIRSKQVNTKKINFYFEKLYKYDDKIFYKKSSDKRNSEGIYDKKDYIEAFKHLINIELHVKRVCEKVIIGKNDIGYLSTWLYAMLHLNNGWRHGDVTTFPRLYFEDLLEQWEIKDLLWFEKNKITTEQSRRIISRIISYDFRISKTEVYGHFFCSDTLAPAISTAILMLEVYYEFYNIGAYPKVNQPIMQFNNSKYNEPTSRELKKCFEGCKINDFVFSSLKMNRTVLNLIYNIACEVSPSGYNALLIPKTLRKHINEISTVGYIKFSIEEIEFLCGELFERGEFGFITDSLLNLVIEKSKESIDRTNDIKKINKLFGGVNKIESTVCMLNSFKNEQEEIIDMLNKYSIDECLEKLGKIYMNDLPSKEIDVQCLFSDGGCKCMDISCLNCKFRIPSMYLLLTLGRTLREEIEEYICTSRISKKIKLSSKIHNKIDVVKEAITKYGQEYVYNCMDIDRKEFLQMFDRVEEVEQLLCLC